MEYLVGRDKVELVGSCSTLIAEKILSKNIDFLRANKVLCHLLYAAILTDTACLKKVPGKATDKDIRIAEKLEEIFEVVSSANRIKIFDEIDEAKCDLSGLSALDVLEKDCKMIPGLVISSIPLRLEDFLYNKLNKSHTPIHELETVFREFCHMRSACALVVLTVFRSSTTEEQLKERQVMIFSESESLTLEIFEILNDFNGRNGLNLKLEEITDKILDKGDLNVLAFDQGNIYQSRKNILPVLQREFSGSKNSAHDAAS